MVEPQSSIQPDAITEAPHVLLAMLAHTYTGIRGNRWIDRQIDGCMNGWMDGWPDGWLAGWLALAGWLGGWVIGWKGRWTDSRMLQARYPESPIPLN